MPIISKRLEWTMPIRDWDAMPHNKKLEFLVSKGFDLNKFKLIKTTNHLIKIVQKPINDEQDKIEELEKQTYISKFIADGYYSNYAKKMAQEKIEEQIKGLQFYPFYKPEE